MDNIIKFLFVIIGIVFTFYIPGFLFVETFFSYLSKIVKIPLYILVSLFASTYSIYILSLVIGFSKISILLVFLFFSIWLCVFSVRRKLTFNFKNVNLPPFILALICFVLFLIALFPAIFAFHNGYIVMSAENWQDTAMHMGITESISQGNFPPTAPYFSGQPLSYYYFIDFHASIIETLTGGFFPRVFVYLNPFFIAFFVLAVYGLAISVTKNKFASLLSSFLAAFYGNFMFVNFLHDVINGGKPLDLIAAKGYTLNYNGIMNVSPMADYFLQNRPMMIGLPGFAVILTLFYLGFKNEDKKLIFLGGLIVALFVKFQFFVFIAGLGAFIFSLLCFGIGKHKFKIIIEEAVIFGVGCIPGFLLLIFLKVGNSSLFDLVKQTFASKPWIIGKPVLYYLEFVLENFGIQAALVIFSVCLILLKKFKLTREIICLFVCGVVFFILPFLIRFTIYDGDMFKFFYLSIIPLSIIASFALNHFWKNKFFGKIAVFIVVFFASFTCLINLSWSFLNKNFGYSLSDYDAGLFIRENTPKKSVFIEMPTVHSAITEIGGRPRVLSYITWPYSHGFNIGADNVFSRLNDIKAFYASPDLAILRKYSVNYVYLGPEERNNYPDAEEKLDRVNYLTKIYEEKDTAIYKVSI